MPSALSPYSSVQFVFFGDSLSDDGNLAAATEDVIDNAIWQPLADLGGQVSNGPVFSEGVAAQLGLTASLNYAVAGGEAAATQTLRDFLTEFDPSGDLLTVPLSDIRLDYDMNLNAQIDRFAADTTGQANSDRTGFVLIGGNDYLELASSSLNILNLIPVLVDTLETTVDATIAAADRLGQLGFGEIVVSALPSAAFFPIFSELPDVVRSVLETVIDAHNDGLRDGVADLRAQGYNAVYLDMEAMSDALANDPTAFGFVAPLSLTLSDASTSQLAAFDEDRFAFFDDVHPSAATHAMLGAYTAWALHDQVDVLSGAGNVHLAEDDGRMVLALGGSDTVTGGDGDDLLFLGTGNDSAMGGLGNDLILAGRGRDTIDGGAGDDLLSDGRGDDVVRGGAGDDVLFDGIGSDSHFGGAGNDVFIFFDDALLGGSTANGDNDSFDGGIGMDALIVIVSEAAADEIVAANITDENILLDAFGISVTSIEQVKFLLDVEALESFDWYQTADLWGMV